MILSFDDGYADVYNYALPARLAHHEQGILSTTLANDHYRLLHLNPTRYVRTG